MKKYLLPLLILTTTASAQAWQVQTNANENWLLQQKAKPSVYSEMNKYFIENDPSNNALGYVLSFVPALHKLIVGETKSAIALKLSASDCNSSTEVSFPETLTNQHSFSSKNEFEESFLKVQSYACLGKLNLDKVFETLMSEAFQRKAINGLKDISVNPKDNRACVETSIFGLGTSRYCLTKNVLRTKNQYIIHSFNEENVSEPSAPIYFKETINVLTQLPNGEVSIYNLMYARGPDLSFRSIVKSKATQQQEAVTHLLIEMAK